MATVKSPEYTVVQASVRRQVYEPFKALARARGLSIEELLEAAMLGRLDAAGVHVEPIAVPAETAA